MANPGSSAVFIAAAATCLKLLLVPAYHSTDFEVHRNWLAITSSLPISQWYVDETSPWTLDYPPLFAWFERTLAAFARVVDPVMTDVTQGLEYASPRTVLFQRLSVMVSDTVLVYATYRYCRGLAGAKTGKGAGGPSHPLGDGGVGTRYQAAWVLGAVLVLPGLIIVDHIHFQYNGMLLGSLILCVALIREGNDWAAGLVFAVLCCTKHLFAVAGPWFALFLFRAHCIAPPVSLGRVVLRTSFLGLTVVSVLGVTFGPFIAMGQMPQLLSRLFPFGRGLCHAYWAPNMWALYNAADKALVTLAPFLPLPPSLKGVLLEAREGGGGSFTRGLVGHGSGTHAVLPTITPGVSLALVLLSMAPLLVQVWRHPTWHRDNAATSLAQVFLCAFLFGWHVHEKAALHFLVLLALAAADTRTRGFDFLYLSTVVNYSLFPLLFGYAEYPIKVLLLLTYTLALGCTLGVCESKSYTNQGHAASKSKSNAVALALAGERRFGAWEVFCVVHACGLVAVELYVQVLHMFLFGKRMDFLPLMLTSVYTAVGIVAFFFRQTWNLIYLQA